MRIPKGYRRLKLISPVQQQTEMAKMLAKKRKQTGGGAKMPAKKRKQKGAGAKAKSKSGPKSIKGKRVERKDIFTHGFVRR